MIYIDSPRFKRKNGRVKYAHMTADSIEELHEFAIRCCIPRHWFEYSRSGIPHYDLNPKYYKIAKENL
jgi:hypothetical protein